MKIPTLIAVAIAAALVSTAFAETKPSQQNEIETILKAVTQMQGDIKTLQTTVANLAASQSEESKRVSAQIGDIGRRLYATCVLTQRLMDVSVPGGWSENALCTYKGLTAPGVDVTQDIFGQNPVEIDTRFGGP